MATLSVTANSGGDGNVYVDAGGTWANVKSLGTGTAQPATDPVNVYTGNLGGGGNMSISRLFIPFDTSTLPDDATITAATITITCASVTGASTFHIVESTQNDPTSLVDGDFDAITGATGTMTSLGSLAISTTGAKVLTLSAGGLALISKTGYSKFAFVEDHDVTNSDPGGASDFRISVNTSNNGTAGNRPTLDITYTTSVAHTKELSETVTISEVFTRAMTKTPTEEVTITDTILRGITRTFTETALTIMERFVGRFGRTPAFTKQEPDDGDWTRVG